MRCERAQELFSEYCEDSIQPALKIPFEDHLLRCANCREQVEDLRVVWKILDDAPVVEPPPGFRASVLQKIDEAEHSKQNARWRIVPNLRSLFSRSVLGWSVAALLLIVLAGTVLPVKYTGAGLGLFWSRQSPAVTIDMPKYENTAGQTIVAVPIRCDQATRIGLKLIDAPVGVNVRETELRVVADNVAVAHIDVPPGTQNCDVKLEVLENDVNGKQLQSRTITLKSP